MSNMKNLRIFIGKKSLTLQKYEKKEKKLQIVPVAAAVYPAVVCGYYSFMGYSAQMGTGVLYTTYGGKELGVQGRFHIPYPQEVDAYGENFSKSG